jgi:TPR repeat protein
MNVTSAVTSVVPYNRNQTYQGFLSSRSILPASISSLHFTIPVARVSLLAPQQSLGGPSLDAVWQKAMRDDPHSQYALAREFFNRGEKPRAKFLIWEAAKKGHAPAMYDCARLYMRKESSSKAHEDSDARLAFNFLSQAAKLNLPQAHCALGEVYRQPHKFNWIRQDPSEAVKHFVRATQLGDCRAMSFLGDSVENGYWAQGSYVESNPETAKMLFAKAISFSNSSRDRPIFEPRYSPCTDLLSLSDLAENDGDKPLALEYFRRAAVRWKFHTTPRIVKAAILVRCKILFSPYLK